MPESVVAVLTGDVVKSSLLSVKELDGLRRAIERIGSQMKWDRGLRVWGPEFFRGDAWQLALSQPQWAVRAALLMTAELRSLGLPASRIAVGIGPASRIDRRRVSRSVGEAFTRSGRSLDTMPRVSRLALSISPHVGLDGVDVWPVAMRLCDTLARQWTARQAQTVARTIQMPGATHDQIGASFRPRRSKQTITRSLASAGWIGVAHAVECFESVCLDIRQP